MNRIDTLEDCGAVPSAAHTLDAALDRRLTREGRAIVGPGGRVLFTVQRGDFDPHETDVLAEYVLRCLNGVAQ